MPEEKKRSRRKFSEEFKRDAAALVVDTGRPVAQVARELDVYESSLGRWVAQLRADRGETDALTTDERARLRELEREVADLRMERDLLKRSVAFWVRETSTR
ncbi:MAG: transposase [Actinomycetota bacterium]|nr:transposase [Actinomycetota bacterium]MDQ3452548.1 transposase [Actinomycetota bacterium]